MGDVYTHDDAVGLIRSEAERLGWGARVAYRGEDIHDRRPDGTPRRCDRLGGVSVLNRTKTSVVLIEYDLPETTDGLISAVRAAVMGDERDRERRRNPARYDAPIRVRGE